MKEAERAKIGMGKAGEGNGLSPPVGSMALNRHFRASQKIHDAALSVRLISSCNVHQAAKCRCRAANSFNLTDYYCF
jgi:hypothetical protein